MGRFAAILLGVLSIGLAGMWVRSYWQEDALIVGDWRIGFLISVVWDVRARPNAASSQSTPFEVVPKASDK